VVGVVVVVVDALVDARAAEATVAEAVDAAVVAGATEVRIEADRWIATTGLSRRAAATVQRRRLLPECWPLWLFHWCVVVGVVYAEAAGAMVAEAVDAAAVAG
jgi:hypothetical protein